MNRPPGIYASSASRRDLARRRARLGRTSLLVRSGNWVALAALVVLAATIAQRLLG
jgi:hypothetical protein